MSDKFNGCFCGLALGELYQDLALELAQDLAAKAPNIPLVILTDKPQRFVGVKNVIVIKHHHHFGYRPYNDKVFVLEAALQRFAIAIQIDVDTKIVNQITDKINKPWSPGITARWEPLTKHVGRYNPKDLPHINKLGHKLSILPKQTQWVGESMFVVTRDNGKEQQFLAMWKKLAYYWDIHKLGSKDGTPIGLAAASVGWDVSSAYWQDLMNCLKHYDVHRQVNDSQYTLLKQQWNYRFRIYQTKLRLLFQPNLIP